MSWRNPCPGAVCSRLLERAELAAAILRPGELRIVQNFDDLDLTIEVERFREPASVPAKAAPPRHVAPGFYLCRSLGAFRAPGSRSASAFGNPPGDHQHLWLSKKLLNQWSSLLFGVLPD
jgi:hypothetical protein